MAYSYAAKLRYPSKGILRHKYENHGALEIIAEMGVIYVAIKLYFARMKPLSPLANPRARQVAVHPVLVK